MNQIIHSIPEWHHVDDKMLHAEIIPQYRPAVLRGFVKQWPVVQQGLQSPESVCQYLKSFDNGSVVNAIMTRPEVKGRIFYNDGMTGFNFIRNRLPISAIADTEWEGPMDNIERLIATDEIAQLKARYFRGVDTCDGELVRSILAEDCVLDYRGCCTDPKTGQDFIPAMNVTLRGRSSWRSDGLSSVGIVSVHQGHNFELEFTSDTTAKGIWSMTDRLYFPPGGAFSLMTGYGHYFETYEKTGRWMLKTTRISRIRVEVS